MATPIPELIGSPLPAISVILPVLNEESHLEGAVLSVLSQDYRGPLEIILALGPSRDRTNEIATKLASHDNRVKLLDSPTGKTAAGLNLALAASKSPVVVRVDGHAQIPNNYISLIVEILNKTGAVNVGGVMAAVGTTAFERAVAGAMRSPLGVGASRFHTGGEAGEVDTVYLGAFRREALVAIGGFDGDDNAANVKYLYYTSDGGKTWGNPSNRLDPTGVLSTSQEITLKMFSDFNNNIVVIGDRGGFIRYSPNNGHNWYEIIPAGGLSNIQSAYYKDDVLIIGTIGGIIYTGTIQPPDYLFIGGTQYTDISGSIITDSAFCSETNQLFFIGGNSIYSYTVNESLLTYNGPPVNTSISGASYKKIKFNLIIRFIKKYKPIVLVLNAINAMITVKIGVKLFNIPQNPLLSPVPA